VYGHCVAAGQAGKAGAAARGSGRGVGLGRRSAAGQGEMRGRWGREPGRLRPWAWKLSGGPRRRKTLFHLYFQGIFKCQLSNIILSKKMTSFENVPKMKVD